MLQELINNLINWQPSYTASGAPMVVVNHIVSGELLHPLLRITGTTGNDLAISLGFCFLIST